MKLFTIISIIGLLFSTSISAATILTWCPAPSDIHTTPGEYYANIGGVYYNGKGENKPQTLTFSKVVIQKPQPNNPDETIKNDQIHCHYIAKGGAEVPISAGTDSQKIISAQFHSKSDQTTCEFAGSPSQCVIEVELDES